MFAVARFFVLLICCALAFGSTLARADYPDKPIHIVVGFAPGGGTDITARLIGQKLSQKWSQPVVVENRVGADGSVAADFISRAAPDGYWIAFISNAHTVTPLDIALGYDPIKSFAPISLVTSVPEVFLVNPEAAPAGSVKEFVALAKSKPGKLSYGTNGGTGADALASRLFMREAGLDLVGVAYTGGGQSMPALLGGEIQVMLTSVTSAAEYVKAGKLKALFVTSKTRSQSLPDVPTIAEAAQMPEFAAATQAGTWYGALAPAGTPKEIVQKLRDGIAEVIKFPDVQQVLSNRGFDSVANTPEEFSAIIAADISRWAAVHKASVIKK